MTTGRHAYHFTTGRYRRFPGHYRALDERHFRAGPSAITNNLAPAPDVPPVWAQDLLQVAKAVYLVDKLSRRATAPDRWTRDLTLSVQVIEPERWSDRVEPLLTALLELLTADRWTVGFHGGAAALRTVPTRLFEGDPAEEVTLFSGGLDSTGWVAQRIGVDAGPLLLVSYYEGTLKTRQNQVFAALRRLGARAVERRQVLQQVKGFGPPLELSSRSRGLLYLATAVHVAAAHRVREVAVPENGQLAVNPPLTASRLAASSTRSVHPRTLHLLNRLIAAVGGDVTVVNPLVDDTKGDVCRRALTAGLPLPTLAETVSCGQPPENRGASRFAQCGCCYPCLIRRSGLLAGTGRDDTAYRTDVWALPDDADLARHRRALAAWMSRGFGIRDLTTDVPLPPGADPAALLRTVRRGRDEIRQLFERFAPGTLPAGT
ncbi:7-cyano-7-deazaguanine synthase [Micromonospora inyonensis]|uniref:Queuosine biosynthesis protein QueC n=1 Tax=Micromonospora inyonensis TaxID=47866 RepID=A0A1C6RST5_9ACTN|nr:7-cyano-7-deazaguanine synthase [Micromonospora inyonensis]SCL20112.1 Queuosine biosynthesis protein QueC [Micromonospora inyonensis]